MNENFTRRDDQDSPYLEIEKFRSNIGIVVKEDIMTVNANRNEEDLTFDYSSSIMLPTNVNQEGIKVYYES